MTSTGFQFPVAMNDTAPMKAMRACTVGSVKNWATSTLRLRREKFLVGSVATNLVMLGMSTDSADQTAMFAAKRARSEIVCPSPANVQMFIPFVCATPARLKYIQIAMARMAGAAIDASLSTALIPSATFTV
jgi:hypothetical protein